MSEAKVGVIEAKVSELQTELQRLADVVSAAETAIKKLSSEREQSIANMNTVNGAMKAYADIVAFLKSPETPAPTPAVPASGETPVVQPASGTVVEGEVVKQ